MGSFRKNNIHSIEKSVVVELLKGKEMAIQLQNLLHKPAVGEADLALQILTSFTNTLSMLSTSCAAHVATGVGGGGRKKKVGVKDRRGCYQRRRTSDSWITISPVMGDGYAWRKYGQKLILNSEYPRCYFRCTKKYDQGCRATKQVQRIKEKCVTYQTTYFNHHTCTDHTPIIRAPPPIMGSDPVEPNSLSFQTSSHSDTTMIIEKKEEETKLESAISEDIKSVSGPTTSSLDQWLEFIGSGSFGYKPNGAPLMGCYQDEGCHSRWPASLHGLDMDVNDHLGDIENFHFDEIV